MNARDFFAAQHRAAKENAARLIETDTERERKATLRALAEICGERVDLSSVVFEGGVVVFPDGPRLSFHGEGSHDAFTVQGQCPQCGETCWSGRCFTAGRVGEMLEEFEPHGHSCPVPGEGRPIAAGDDVTVELGGEMCMGPVEVLATPRDSGGYWQFSCDGNVYALSTSAAFLITRSRVDKPAAEF